MTPVGQIYMEKLQGEFRVDLLYPDEYNDFIAEIYYKDRFLCLISQENGFEDLEMECFSTDVKFRLSEFEVAILYAKQRLFDLRKEGSSNIN